ncbi:MAG TPA: aminotransferase class III-fold pyridoxal phosphate-dependent enzyme [Microthrixaceae bacterium]|nr:aminotransferase class III-fold pyridoxal phosphate-dependent enzyme [Microthrixaceae bacterium]
MSHLAPVWFQVTDLQVESGHGSVVVTTDGTEYLDFTAGIAVTSTGHCHPKVVAAISEQAAKFIHAQVNCYRHPLLEQLGARLAEITPPTIDTFFYANSGAEATEGALKLAKQATGRPNVIVFSGSFHGRTHQAMAMTTSKTSYRAGYAPLPSGAFVAPFPHWQATGETEADATRRCLAELRDLLMTQTAPAETAAVFLEPVLGEGGYLPAPRDFLRGVVDVCRELDLLFVADEVQSGFCRTGRWFAVEHYDVEPDIIVMAKGIASGFPISAIGASAALMSRWPVGSHGGTYGGNPIGCAAALATIDVMSESGFLDSVEARGEQLRAGLSELAAKHPVIRDVRGLGLMNGVELYEADGSPATARVAQVVAHCREEGRLLLMNAGTYGNILRWMPPLVVTRDEVSTGLAAFATALDATG